jgi:hypothetical protein
MHWSCPLPQSAAQMDLYTLSPRHAVTLPRSNALFAVVRQVTSSAAASVHVGKQQGAAEQAVDASDAAVSANGLAVSLMQGDGNAVPIVPNTHSVPFANPYFEGRALLILRTDSQQKYAHVFCDSRKHTQMVLQVQGKFKVKTAAATTTEQLCVLKYRSVAQVFGAWYVMPGVQVVPQGRLYVGAEIPEQPKFSWLLKVNQRQSTQGELLSSNDVARFAWLCAQSFWKTVVAFARPVLPALHYSFGNSKFNELTHFVTPLYSSCDQVVITPSGAQV